MSHLDDRVLAAWTATAWLHEPHPPASLTALEVVEEAVGRHLPKALRELYQRHDGGSWLGSELSLMPLLGEDLSVARASGTYRGWDWPVADEVVIFGSNGCGDPFGLWLPRSSGARPLVVQIGAIFEAGCMAVVAEDLNAFLRAWTAYYLLLPDRREATAGLDALDVPEHLRPEEPGDDTFVQIVEWASPTMSGLMSSPYEAELTAEDVRRIAARSS